MSFNIWICFLKELDNNSSKLYQERHKRIYMCNMKLSNGLTVDMGLNETKRRSTQFNLSPKGTKNQRKIA